MFLSLSAKLILAFWALIHFIKWPFRQKRRGAGAFLTYYGTEGLLPLASPDKDLLLKFSECLQCGYCDTACPSLWQATAGAARAKFPGPARVLTTWSRLPGEIAQLDWDFEHCAQCAQCGQACPNQIPVEQAWQWLAAKQKELQAWVPH